MVRGRIVGHILSMIYHIILELYNQPLVIIHFLSELQKLSRLSCVLFMHHSIISNFIFIQVFHVGRLVVVVGGRVVVALSLIWFNLYHDKDKLSHIQ